MILGMDIGPYTSKADWVLLYEKGVRFAVIKATQGDYLFHRKSIDFVSAAQQAGLIAGIYHWQDPAVDAQHQADWFYKACEECNPDFLAVDVEQNWIDWAEWSSGNITRHYQPAHISENARILTEKVHQYSGLKTLVYTRASFVQEYALPMKTWLPDWPLWLAHWPYPAGSVNTNWEMLKTSHMPVINGPSLPPDCSDWVFWQFSGDRFRLPGVDALLDLNLFNGTESELKAFFGKETSAPSLSLEERLAALEREAVLRGWEIETITGG